MADHNENGILEGAIKRGVDFIKGPEGKLQQLHVNTSFLADCSPMDVMFRVRDNGEVEDMRPQFLTELLKMDGVWYSTGKVSGAAGDAGYRKFYTLDIGACLEELRKKADDDSTGPFAKFLELWKMLNADPLLARSSNRTDFFRIDPPGMGADTEHGDASLTQQEKETGRTRVVSKNSSGSKATCGLQFRRKTQQKGGTLVDRDEEAANAHVPSSGAGSTYGCAAPAMGAVEVEESAAKGDTSSEPAVGPSSWFWQHTPITPMPVEMGQEGEDGEKGEEGQPWTCSWICDRVELGAQAQLRYVKIHHDLMGLHQITPEMVAVPWNFEPPRPDEIRGMPFGSGVGNAAKAAKAAKTQAKNAAEVAKVLAKFFNGSAEEATRKMKGSVGASVAKEHALEIYASQNPSTSQKPGKTPAQMHVIQQVVWEDVEDSQLEAMATGIKKAWSQHSEATAAAAAGTKRARDGWGLMEAAAEEVNAGEPPQLEECVLRCTHEKCSHEKPVITVQFMFSHDKVRQPYRRKTWYVVEPECCICKAAGRNSTLQLFCKDADGKEVPLTEKNDGIKYVHWRTAIKWNRHWMSKATK